MKKSTVTMLAVGAALVFIGGISSTIAYLNGAVGIHVRNGLLGINLDDLRPGTDHGAVAIVEEDEATYQWEDEKPADEKPAKEYFFFSAPQTSLDTAELGDSFSNVVINSGVANVTIRPTNGSGSLNAENIPEGSLGCSIENGTLYIKNQSKMLVNFDDTPQIELNLPSGTQTVTVNAGIGKVDISRIDVDTLEISGGTGEISLGKVNADTLILKSGTGGIEAENFTCARLEADSGFGEIELNGSVQHAEIQGGAGTLSFEGKITKSFNISCGFGEVDLTLDGTPEDYYFSLAQTMGSITFSDAELPADANYAGTPGAPCSGELTCGLGTINISFKDAAFTEEPDGIRIPADFENVEIRSSMADVTLSTGSEGLIRSSGPNSQIDWEIDDGTFRLNLKNDFHANVEVILPDSINLNEVTLSSKLNAIYADNLTMKKLSAWTETGSITIDNFACETLNADVSTGYIGLKNGSAQTTNLICGTGKLFFSGKIEDSFDISGSTGHTELALAGSPDDYFIKLEQNERGHISIGNQEIASNVKTFGNENARCSGELSISMGSAEITFTE